MISWTTGNLTAPACTAAGTCAAGAAGAAGTVGVPGKTGSTGVVGGDWAAAANDSSISESVMW